MPGTFTHPTRTKRERADIEAQKQLRTLQLLLFWMQPRTPQEAAAHLGCHHRTTRRYLHLFEHAGFRVECLRPGLYQAHSPVLP